MQNNTRNVAMLANHEQRVTMQKHINNLRNNPEELGKDYKLAMYFHNFLSSKSNKLPNYDFLNKIISANSKNTSLEVISIALGLSVLLFNLDNTNYFQLEIITRITDGINRIDKISSSSYDAYTIDWSGHIEDVDIEEFPMFDSKRVLHLQKYLAQYQLNKMNTSNNTKSK